MTRKPSFFERLTGSQYYEEEKEASRPISKKDKTCDESEREDNDQLESDGQLAVDVYQTENEIIIETMIPAVKIEDLDIGITREMVTIKGARDRHRIVEDDQFFFRELFWGSFSRTILLPQEIEPDQADAREKNGLLTIVLPKSDRHRQHKIKVKPAQT